MAYTVNMYTFSKKRNSTAQPTGDGTVFSCKVKDGSGILNPTLILDFREIVGVEPQNLNYAYISEFSRYYFITDWSYIAGLWECYLTVDVLASWKTSIGSQNLYILRSASSYDTTIVDTAYPTKTGVTFSATTQNSNPFATTFSAGSFVVGIINNDSSAIGAVSYYIFTNAEFRAFAAYLLGSTSYWGTTEISDQLLKCLYNPFQYIVSCTWLPVSPPAGAAVSAVPVGWWSIPVSATRLSGTVRTAGTVTVTIPKHPNGATRNYFYGEPFSTYYLDFPPFGAFTIPAAYLVSASYVDFAWNVDCITGQGKLQMGADNSAQPFNIVHGQVGVPVQLAQMTPDVMGAIQQVIPQSRNDTVNSVIQTLGNIASAWIQSQLPMQTTGGTGGFSAGYYPIRLTGIFAYQTTESIAEFGRPYCQNATISSLSGFVQCAHTDFAIPATDPEIGEIGSYLTSGFFYE